VVTGYGLDLLSRISHIYRTSLPSLSIASMTINGVAFLAQSSTKRRRESGRIDSKV
jgi:hypothetical protein